MNRREKRQAGRDAGEWLERVMKTLKFKDFEPSPTAVRLASSQLTSLFLRIEGGESSRSDKLWDDATQMMHMHFSLHAVAFKQIQDHNVKVALSTAQAETIRHIADRIDEQLPDATASEISEFLREQYLLMVPVPKIGKSELAILYRQSKESTKQ